METDALFYGVELPLFVAVVVQCAVRLPRKTTPSDLHCNQATALALSTAYLSAHWGLHGLPTPSAMEAWEWLLLLVPAAVLFAAAETALRLSARRRGALFACLAVACGWFFVPDFQTQPWMWRAALATLTFLLWAVLSNPACRISTRLLAAGGVITFAGGVPVLVASANAKFALFSLAGAVACGVILVFAARRETMATRCGALPVICVLLPGLQLSGYFNDYRDVPLASFLLITGAPLGVVAAGLPILKHRRRWLRALVALGGMSAMATAAVGLAWPMLSDLAAKPPW